MEPISNNVEFSLIDLALKGGWLMLPLLLLSIFTIYLFVAKLLEIKSAISLGSKFMENIDIYINNNKPQKAVELCKESNSPIAKMLEAGIEKIDRPIADVQMAIENRANIEVSLIEKGLPMMATIAGGAPMIGFLGTVIGMVQAFFNMAQAGSNVDITLLSGGIYTAMVTTVAGLTVGILAYFGYNYLTSRVSALVLKMERVKIEFLDLIQ